MAIMQFNTGIPSYDWRILLQQNIAVHSPITVADIIAVMFDV